MVKKRFIFLLLLVVNSSISAQKMKDINLYISFSNDSVCFDDTVLLELYFKNTSDSVFYFSKGALIGMSHYDPDGFIGYDTAERMLYWLNDNVYNMEIVSVMPGQTYRIDFKVRIKKSFFYKGENTLRLFYNSSKYFSKRFRKKRVNEFYPSHVYLWSNSIKIFVKV